MFPVWFSKTRYGYQYIFCTMSSRKDAERVSAALVEEGFVYTAWVEEV